MERDFLHNLSQNLKIETLETDVSEAAAEFAPLKGGEVADKLAVYAKQVDTEEKDGILALCLQIMGCDSYLAAEEITNFFVIAKILGVEEERGQLMLAQLTNDIEDVVA